MKVTRRLAIGYLAAGLLGVVLPSEGETRPRRKPRKKRRGPSYGIKEIQKGKLGTTLIMELKESPFPYKGKPWKDATTVVFVPHHHRVSSNKKRQVHTIVHFHGHKTTALQSMKDHQLREQLAESKQNAILVMPQGPLKAPTGHPGKLGEPRGFLKLLGAVRKQLQSPKARKALGKSGLHRRSRIGKVCISAHSGGYRAAANCLKHGKYEVSEVYLFDSLYGERAAFLEWLKKGKRTQKQWSHKLISFYAGASVKRQNVALMRELERHKIDYLHETREGQLTRQELTMGRAVFIRTKISHGAVTHRYNELRDCLYASSLPRRLKSSWFDRKTRKRELEPRKNHR